MAVKFNPKSATETEARAVFDVSRQTLNEWRNAGAPFRKKAGRVLYNLPSLIAWRVARETRAKVVVDDPEVESGADSPALERFRSARASQEELKLAERRNQVYPRAEVDAAFVTAGALFKNSLGEWVVRLPEKLAGLDVRSIGAILEAEAVALQCDISAQMMKVAGPETVS